MQVTLRQVQIDHGVFQVRVSHEKLDRPQVGPGFHQGCRETVAKRVRTDRLLDSCAFRRFAADVPDCMVRKRLLYAAMTLGAGEEINPGALPAEILAEGFEQLGRHRYIAVPRTLALVNVDHHTLAIDVTDFQERGLSAAYAGREEKHEDGPVCP